MNARIYCLLLRFYPAELRHDFGAEMAQVFLDDMADSRRRDGLFGAFRVWWRSLGELLCIALPATLSDRYILVPAMIYLLQVLDLSAIVIGAHRGPGSPLPHSAMENVALVMLPGVLSAAIGFVALYIGDRSVPEPLTIR